MDPTTAVILGVLQGLFEWLPVSSEAVLTIVMTQFFDRPGFAAVNAAVWMHTGTMLAALLYFRAEFHSLLQDAYRAVTDRPAVERVRLLWFVVAATAVTGAVGGAIYLAGLEAVASFPNLFMALTGVALVVTGLLRLYGGDAGRSMESVGTGDAVLTGGLQGMAILPGVSRSGSTTFALLYRGIPGEDAFRLSFILSVPAVLAANIGINLFSGFAVTPPLLLAAGTAFAVSYAVIDVVLAVARRTAVAYLCFGLAAISFLPLLLAAAPI